MSSFTPAEIAYLKNQRVGRLEKVGADGQPHMLPVAFRYKA
jgi:pyridoxamine 5'-phosphate oxidase family protein